MCTAWYHVEFIPNTHFCCAGVVGEFGVEIGADRVPVADGGGGGDSFVGFAVVVEDFFVWRRGPGLEVGPGGLESWAVDVVAGDEPVSEGVVGDVFEGGEVGGVLEVEVPFDPFSAVGTLADRPCLGCVVVFGGAVEERGAVLVGNVDLTTLRVFEALQGGPSYLGTLLSDGAVLSRRGVDSE